MYFVSAMAWPLDFVQMGIIGKNGTDGPIRVISAAS